MEALLARVDSLSTQLQILQNYVASKFGSDFEAYLKEEGRRSTSHHAHFPLGDEGEEEEEEDPLIVVKEEAAEEDFGCIFPNGQEEEEEPSVIPCRKRRARDPDYQQYQADSSSSSSSKEDGRVKRLRLRKLREEEELRFLAEDRKARDRTLEIPTLTPGLRVFPGNQGIYIATLHGFLYNFAKKCVGRLSFYCDQSRGRRKLCRGILYLSTDYRTVLSAPGEGNSEPHNHAPCPGATDVRYGMWKMKALVAQRGGTLEGLEEIHSEVSALLTPEGRELFPDFKKAKRIVSIDVKRKRKKESQQNQELSAPTSGGGRGVSGDMIQYGGSEGYS